MIDDSLYETENEQVLNEINDKPLNELPKLEEYTNPITQKIESHEQKKEELKKELESEGENTKEFNTKLNDIKKKFDDNVYLSFAKSCYNKYKYLFLFIIVIIVIAFIELRIAQNISDCCYYLDKRKILKIRPPCLHLAKSDYIYVYNISMFEKRSVIEMANIPATYKKKSIMEHISVSISRPLKHLKESFNGLFNSCTPISNLSNTLASCCRFSDKISPLSSGNILLSDWCIMYPPYLNVKCFVSKNKIMFSI